MAEAGEIFNRLVTEQQRSQEAVRALNAELVERLGELDLTRGALALAGVDEARAEERRSVAADLHDDTVQRLLAAGWSIDRLLPDGPAASGGGVAPPPESTEAQLLGVKAILDEAVGGLRRMIFHLHPRDLELAGLGAALRALLTQLGEENGLEWRLDDRLAGRICPDLEARAFRVCREALLNVGRHAGAGRVEVVVEASEGQLRATVADDGVGLDPEALGGGTARGHVGLVLARESVLSVGGSFEVHRNPSGGSIVAFSLPLDIEPPEPRQDNQHR